VLILAICRPAAGADPARFKDLLADEVAAMRRLKADGALTQAWFITTELIPLIPVEL